MSKVDHRAADHCIGSASLAGRKWGPAVSGWIIGMPLTPGPVLFFVALNPDLTFVANTALDVISGGLSLVTYSLTYAWLAPKGRPCGSCGKSTHNSNLHLPQSKTVPS